MVDNLVTRVQFRDDEMAGAAECQHICGESVMVGLEPRKTGKQTMMQVAQQPGQPAVMPVAPPPPITQQQRLGAGAVLQKTAPRLLPYGGWPNPAPAMLDPTRPYQLMRHWLNR